MVRDPDSSRKPAVTGTLAEIIILPNFRLSTALLDCEKETLRWPGPFDSGFLSPQPPGVVGTGPVRRGVYSYTGPTKVGPFSFWAADSEQAIFSAAATLAIGISAESGEARNLERFPAKWIPVRVKKTRQNER
jgi:hypothetical protein